MNKRFTFHPPSRVNQRGSFLIAAMVIIVLLTGLGLAISGLAATQYQHTVREVFTQNASLVAEAGIEQTVNQLNSNDSFAGFSSAQQLFSNSTQGKGTFTTTVTNAATSNAKTIVSTGLVYRHTSDSTPYLTRKVRVTVVGTSSQGYSVYTGPGGLILGGSASITNSEVYVNGYINMSGNSTIGSTNNPLQVNVANDQCPTGGGSTYPQVCSDGTQPITMSQSTHIYGTVCATGQTSTGPNNNITGGNGGSGLKVGCTAPTVSSPTYDRMAQINSVTTTANSTDSSVDCTQWQSGSGFSRTWAANLKLTGNVNLANSCNLTLTGNVYITGNLTIGGSARIRVADSAGTTPPVIIVDGTISVTGSGSMIANSQGTGAKFISFKSANACTTSTTSYCSSITGNDLYNSQSTTTVSIGGSTKVPGMIFQAYWGEIVVAGSGNVGAVSGQTVNLNGAGTVVFGTQLSSGSRTWAVTSYQQIH